MNVHVDTLKKYSALTQVTVCTKFTIFILNLNFSYKNMKRIDN